MTPGNTPLNCKKLILFLEKLGSYRRVRHKDPGNISLDNSVYMTGSISQYNCRERDRNKTEEQEDYLFTSVFPPSGSKTRTHLVGLKDVRLDMTKAICYQTPKLSVSTSVSGPASLWKSNLPY